MIRDGLAEALDGADAEVITAALRSAGFDDDASAFTADFGAQGALKDLLDKPTTTEARRRTRAAAAAEAEKTTRSSWRRRCAKRSRRWPVSRTGRPRRCSS